MQATRDRFGSIRLADDLFTQDAQSRNPNWHRDAWSDRPSPFTPIRRRLEKEPYPGGFKTDLRLARLYDAALADIVPERLFELGYTLFLAEAMGYKPALAAGPRSHRLSKGAVCWAMSDVWVRGDAEYARLRFLLEAEDGAYSFHYKREDLTRVGERLLARDPLDNLVHRYLIRSYIRQNTPVTVMRPHRLADELLRKWPNDGRSRIARAALCAHYWQNTRQRVWADRSVREYRLALTLFPAGWPGRARTLANIEEIVRKRDHPTLPIRWP